MTTLNRREFLRIGALTTAATVAAACVTQTPTAEPISVGGEQPPAGVSPPTTVPEPAPATAKFGEAPMLADQVAAGTLPPIEERLPENPSVYPVPEMIGRYGGVLRRGFSGMSDATGLQKLRAIGLTHFNPDLSLRPDILESYEISEDATTFTVHLRKGMKWSDGVPFTADAFMWWYEKIELNTDITPRRTLVDGAKEPGEFRRVDDYTLEIAFAHPLPLYVPKQARSAPVAPGHYLEQFHIETAEDPDAVVKEATDKGFDTWNKYFSDRNDWRVNEALPTLSPWVFQNSLASELHVMTRNPYFLGVDPEGNQLPYIDTVNHRLFGNIDVFAMWVVSGEIDWQGRWLEQLDYTLVKSSEEQGEYRTYLWPRDAGESIWLNPAPKSERVKEFLSDRNVRIALNVAIDRVQILELAYNNLGVPRQPSPTSKSPLYHQEASEAYIQYDPEMANRLLDEAGYTERDASGMRVWKDGSGETISFVVEHYYAGATAQSDMLEMVSQYWAEIGIQAVGKGIERSLFEEHKAANMLEICCQIGGHNAVEWERSSSWLARMWWQGGYFLWSNDPEDPNGIEPPEDHWVRTLWRVWDEGNEEPDPVKRNEMFRGITQVWADEVPAVGIIGETPCMVIIKNGMRNFLDGYPFVDAAADESLLGSCVLFWEEPEKHV